MPNATLTLRAYDGYYTGALEGQEEQRLEDGEAEAAQQLIAVFVAEHDMRRNRIVEDTES